MTWTQALKLAAIFGGGSLVAGLAVGAVNRHPLAVALASFAGGAAALKTWG